MQIRHYQPGDEVIQASIYNSAAQDLPGFKPASAEDVRKRTRARGFDPTTRWFAVNQGQVVGYCLLEPQQGRISYPWSTGGREASEALLAKALDEARQRGLKRLFAAYRQDWMPVRTFFEEQGFRLSREMVNFAVNVLDLPTSPTGTPANVTAFRPEDVAFVAQAGAGVLRLPPEALTDYFFANPLFPSESLRVLRDRQGNPLAVGLIIENEHYADVRQADPLAPCFRLGAFGTEGLNVKRINGLFSFLVGDPSKTISCGLALLAEARESLTSGTVDLMAAQVPSDAPHLLAFYSKFFKEQGRFSVYERDL